MKDFTEFSKELTQYLLLLAGRNEATRRSRFQDLLRDYFDIRADELEKSIHAGGFGARVTGRIDALAGNVILEFKDSLTPAHLEEAKNQLSRYVTALSGSGDPRRYTLIATDGNAFQPFRWDNTTGQIEQSDSLIRFEDLGERAYYWLDDWIASRVHAQPVPPEARAVGEVLGTSSSTFFQAVGILKLDWANLRENHQVAYEEWRLSILQVYGTNLATEELFLRHTYITTVAKVLVYYTLRPGESARKTRSDAEVRGILEGDDFRRFGVQNIAERDFFSWLDEAAGGIQVVRGLLDNCAIWDFSRIAEDLLRGLYQELIDPKTRHELGEFYTPLWVAQLLEDEALPTRSLSVIDPACGSGTFLVAAIHKKIGQGESLAEILGEVVGIDVHPVAVTVARTSYLLALQPLLLRGSTKRASFSIPVYLSNSIQSQHPRLRSTLASPGSRVECYSLDVPNTRGPPDSIEVPQSVLTATAAGPVLDSMERGLDGGTWAAIEPVAARSLGAVPEKDRKAHLEILRVAFETIQRLHLEKPPRNRIQLFLLRNVFRPSLLAGQFDRVVGNPPWIVFNSLKDRGVQESIREAFRSEDLMPIESVGALITQLDVSALFFVRTAKTFLKPGGKIRFLLPQPVFSGMQYSGFRSKPRGLPFDHIWDLAGVRPIFHSVQTCAVGAVLGPSGRAMKDPIPCERLKGNLPSKSLTLSDARLLITAESTHVTPVTLANVWTYPEQDVSLLGAGRSYYHPKVRNGATLFPYGLVLSDLEVDPKLGGDTANPAVRSAARGKRQPRRPWKGIDLSGSTEGRFIFQVATMSEILPYGHLELPTAALPILPLPSGEGSEVLDSSGLRSRGFDHLAEYFSKQEAIWDAQHGIGKKEGTGSLKDQIDFRGKLSNHPFKKGWFVVIPTSARVVLAAVLRQGPGSVRVKGTRIPTTALVVDHGNNYLFTPSEDEAHYLCAILNSGPVNAVTKPAILKGRDTERNTYREPLELPIPKFNPGDKQHRAVVELAKVCAAEVEGLLSGPFATDVSKAHIPHTFGALRERLKLELKDRQLAIDAIVDKVLKDQARIASSGKTTLEGEGPSTLATIGARGLRHRASTTRVPTNLAATRRRRQKKKKFRRNKIIRGSRRGRTKGLFPEIESLP